MSAIPDAVLTSHTAVLGKTGSGKTSTSKLLVEQVVDEGYRVCILDPIKSDWWGITSSADGTEPGLPFTILGGPRGHLPLHSSAGAAIGQLVAEGKLPLSIIDMKRFEPGGRQKFFIGFAQALMEHIQGVLYLVVEEAHEFAPKDRPGMKDENLTLYYAKTLATAGRSMGLRMVVATQRTQALHNAVLGSCETVIAHRLTTPADQKPVADWLKANTDKATAADVAASLPSLPTGTAWICSGEARIFEKRAFPKFRTYDNAKTPTSDASAIEVRTASVDQEELRAIIGEAVKEAEENDPKVLKARIAELEKQVTAKAPDMADAIREATTPYLRRLDQMEATYAEAREIVLGIVHIHENLLNLGERLNLIFNVHERVAAGVEEDVERDRAGRTLIETARAIIPPRERTPRPKVERAEGETQRVSPAAIALAELLDRVSPARLTWSQACTITGRKASGGNFNAARKWLRESGRVVEDGDFIRSANPTPDGLDRTQAIALWKSVLSNPSPRMIDALIPGPLSPEDLADTLGIKPTGGNWNNGLAQLRRNGIAEIVGGKWRLVSTLPGEIPE